MEKHDIYHEFPDYEEIINDLKKSDGHFKKLFEEYHKVDKEIYHIESSKKFTDDELKSLRVKRVKLKDNLLNILKNAERV